VDTVDVLRGTQGVMSVVVDELPMLDRVEVRVPRHGTALVCSDLHLAAVSSDWSDAATGALAVRLQAIKGPAVLVFNGDCFELLASPEPSMSAVLDAHPAFFSAVASFLDGPNRQFVVLAGNHDVRLASDREALRVLQARLPATVAVSAHLLFETERGTKVVRVEHGNQFDPANAFADPRDPHDTPLGHHVVQEILPEMAHTSFLADVRWLSDPSEFGQFLASRVAYRELMGRAWWLAVPFVLAFLVRTPLVVRSLSTTPALSNVSRWLIVAGAGVIVDVVAVGAAGVMLARRFFRVVGTSSLGVLGGHRNAPARAAAEALCAEGFAGVVTGHTHSPELRPLRGGFYANSGCGVPTVVRRPARLGLPPVFTGVLRRSWIELDASRDLDARLVLAESPMAGRSRLEQLAAKRVRPRPTEPTVVSQYPGGSGWPIDNTALLAKAGRERTRRMAAGSTLLLAAVGVLSAITPPLRERLHGLLTLMPVEVPQAASVSLVFASLALALLARGLRRGSRIAWATVLGLAALSAVLHMVKGGDIEEALIALAVALWLALRWPAFRVQPDAATVRRGALLAGLSAGLTIALSFALVAVIGAHRRTAVRESLRDLAERLAGRNVLPVPAGSAFVAPALTATVVAIAFALAWLVMAPRRSHRPTAAEHLADRRRAAEIVRRYGGDTLTYFALRDDKQWFFTEHSVVAYAVRNGVCLVSPDPIGPEEERADAWAEFSRFADRNGWSIAVVGAQPGWLGVYEAGGMQPIYMGDEAIVDCQSFTLDGGAMKSLRGAYNRVRKSGFTTRFLDPTEVDDELRAQLVTLMGDTRRGETERGFSMTLSRVFDPEDHDLLLSVALDPDGRPAAFCQWVPAKDIDGWSLDLMRRSARTDLPNGVTDFVVIETINHVRAVHKWGLCLNFAVMRAVVAGEREGRFDQLQRKVLHRFSETMQIESLWRYNEKFRPYWRPRYIVVDAVENAAAQGVAIADAEAIWELPVVGRFLGRRPPGSSS
jgi:lysyl-tRNA synthetase class 2